MTVVADRVFGTEFADIITAAWMSATKDWFAVCASASPRSVVTGAHTVRTISEFTDNWARRELPRVWLHCYAPPPPKRELTASSVSRSQTQTSGATSQSTNPGDVNTDKILHYLFCDWDRTLSTLLNVKSC